MPRVLSLIAAVLLAAGLIGCQQPNVVDDLSDTSFQLVDTDSTAVAFPQDVAGDIVVLGYIYTNCPDVCPMTTANMKQAHQQLGAPDDVQFVTVTFDPLRDTPSVMQRYSETWEAADSDWMFLTGDTSTVNRMMRRIGIRHQVTDTTTTEDGEQIFFISHSDLVTLIDEDGRIRQHYSGSRTPPEILVEDVNKLRNGSTIR
ncbi:MAG: SCO family protein [Bacteroidetes bacterium]|jgi:protein SCO1/2|nr:SCO family protein [Bacteroidota bacterium]